MGAIATHKLSNGWTINEYESTRHAFTGYGLDGAGLARFTVHYFRCPATREARVFHFVASTDDERAKNLATAKRKVARDRVSWMRKYWRRRRSPGWGKGNWVHSAIIGDLIDVDEAFETLRRGLLTDDAVDLEFESIVADHEIGVMR